MAIEIRHIINKFMLYRVVGKMKGEGLGYVLGFCSHSDKAKWIQDRVIKIGQEWKEKEITFFQCKNKEIKETQEV